VDNICGTSGILRLAYDCGINRTYLSAVERSERNVSIDNIARIAKGLKIEPWKLLKCNATAALDGATSGLLVASWLPNSTVPGCCSKMIPGKPFSPQIEGWLRGLATILICF
jgi:hypothetical protein